MSIQAYRGLRASRYQGCLHQCGIPSNHTTPLEELYAGSSISPNDIGVAEVGSSRPAGWLVGYLGVSALCDWIVDP